MIRYIVCLLAAFAVFSSTLVEAAERKFSVASFDTIRINGSVDVDIVTGKGASAKATADSQRTLDRISFRRNGNELIIAVRQETSNQHRFSIEDPMRIHLATFALKKISHLGSGRVTVDRLTGRNVYAQIGGFGTMVVGDVDSDVVEVVMNGGGTVEISGKTREAQLSLLGASSFEGTGLSAKVLKLTQQGPGSVRLAVERQVEIANIGSGIIDIIGRPNCLVRSTGSAQISCNPER